DLAAGRFAVEVEITAQHHVDLEVHVALAEVFQFQLKALDGVPAGQVLAVAAPAEGEVFLLEAQALALELHLGVSARVDLHFVVLGDVVADDLAYVTETPLSRVAVEADDAGRQGLAPELVGLVVLEYQQLDKLGAVLAGVPGVDGAQGHALLHEALKALAPLVGNR